ncbi:MAG: hypothetical protein H7831_15240, partial [Magnetococcus sp. WYHC-3]
GSNGSGSVAGVVMYNEGFIILTGSWDISNGSHTEPYVVGSAATSPKWLYFASTGSSGAGENLYSSSFDMCYEGVQYVNTLTALCRARRGELNYSPNPTWIKYGQDLMAFTGSRDYIESGSLAIKNIAKAKWNYPTASFQKITYIDKIKIYDEHGEVIAIAKLATPVRKKEEEEFCFKICYDL